MFIIVTRFFCYIMLFRLNFFDFINFFFIIIDLYLFIIVGFHVYYFFNWLLKVTLLIMLLNSENSNILYFFLFSVGSLVSILLFLVFTLFNLLGNWLLLLNRWLLRLLVLVVTYFTYWHIFWIIWLLWLPNQLISLQWLVHSLEHGVILKTKFLKNHILNIGKFHRVPCFDSRLVCLFSLQCQSILGRC